ncbi:MAG: hypothetical protein RIT45_459 [Pseudomonadota bacterium]|jgi:CRP-like cAMP-binding protein
MFGLLGRRSSEPPERSRSSTDDRRSSAGEHRPFVDAMDRLERGPRDVARLMADVPIFSDLEPRECEALAEITHIARCHGGTQLWAAGDHAMHVVFVLQGRLEMRQRIGPGVEHVVRVFGEHDIAGLEAALGSETYHLTAFASERSAVLRIPVMELRQVLAVGKPAAVKLYSGLAQQLGQQLRDATLEVVHLLERASVMPQSSSVAGDDVLSFLLKR